MRQPKGKKTEARKRAQGPQPKTRQEAAQGSVAKLQDSANTAKIADQRANKIFPRNLTAQADYLVAGNPVITRPEDAVANCFPGLELDIRNLDRRFFPGLVFEFASPDPEVTPHVRAGAKVAYFALCEDPDLQVDEQTIDRLANTLKLKKTDARKLHDDLYGKLSENKDSLEKGSWYLDWVEQTRVVNGRPKRYRLSMNDSNGEPLDGLVVWRLVRGLEPGIVAIGVRRHDEKKTGGKKKLGKSIKFNGWRRIYADPTTGVINGAYQPGELMQGLCSPWQHDFRDCQCFYWAANHPDVVLGELYPGEALPPTGDARRAPAADEPAKTGLSDQPAKPAAGSPSEGERVLASVPLDWIRADRSRALAAEAQGTIAKNRPYQLDAFEINSAWQALSIVLEGREIGGPYVPQTIETANPFTSPKELANKLTQTLAPLEVTLTLEYLYARFSLLSTDEARKTGIEGLPGAVMLARDRLMLIAVSEMRHLRWVNQILWELFQKGVIPEFKPVLDAAEWVPTGSTPDMDKKDDPAAAAFVQPAPQKHNAVRRFIQAERSGRPDTPDRRRAELRLLTPAAIEDYIAVEHPSGFIDGAYARVITTLRQKQYPENMAELALRIASDGVEHENLFIEIKAALSPYFSPDDTKPHKYLRRVHEAASAADIRKAEPARTLLKKIRENLNTTYILASKNAIQHSGQNIGDARTAMTELLELGETLAAKNVGIPFFRFWKEL